LTWADFSGASTHFDASAREPYRATARSNRICCHCSLRHADLISGVSPSARASAKARVKAAAAGACMFVVPGTAADRARLVVGVGMRSVTTG